MEYRLHELATLYPGMTDEEYKALRADIRKHGQQSPIVLWRENDADDWQIIDGRHRALACDELGVEPKYEFVNGSTDPAQYVISANSVRRQLTQSQLAMVASKLRDYTRENGEKTNVLGFRTDTMEGAGRAVGVTGETVRRAKNVRSRSETLGDAVESGRVTVADAHAVRHVDDTILDEALTRLTQHSVDKPNTLRREVNNVMRELRQQDLADNPPTLPTGKFSTIVIDPPWPMVKIPRDVRPNQTGFDYPTMSVEAIGRLPIHKFLHDDAFVFLWTTQRFLPASFELLRRWDLTYRFTMVWHKAGGFQPLNSPQFNAEFVVAGSFGKPEFVDTKAFPVVFEAPRGKHSEKPDEFYELLQRVTHGPRLDMFARKERDGFDVWGEEVDRTG